MRKHVGPLLALLLIITACSRPDPAEVPVPVQAPAAPVVPELPPAQVEAPADTVKSRVSIADLPSQPWGGLDSAIRPISPADDSSWLNAKAELLKLLERSPNSPATGLQDALVAYYQRPDVLALPAAVADFPHTLRLGQYTGTKDEPDPNGPTVIHVYPLYVGAPAWRISLVRWEAGEKLFAAPLPEPYAKAFRSVTHQGRQALLLFHAAAPGDLALSAYELAEGNLLPLGPAAAPVEFRGASVTAHHPDYTWVCFGEECLTLTWTGAGVALAPAGFDRAAAAARLASTDGNRTPWDRVDRAAFIDQRLASPAALAETPAALAARLGAAVATNRSGNALVRVIHFMNQSWLGGKGYQTGFTRLQFTGGGFSYGAGALGVGGGYIDHRVLEDAGKVYILVLTETEPRPSQHNVLSLFVAEGGSLRRVELPDGIRLLTEKRFVSMDARLMLSCPAATARPAECEAVRLEDGALVTLTAGALAAAPGAEAKQASEKALARFRAGAYPEAAQLFRAATELAPLWVDAWNDLSLAYQRAGDWHAASTAAKTAAEIDPNSPAAQYNLGVSYLAVGETALAAAGLTAAAAMQPESAEVWLALARAREQARLRTTAVEAYQKVLALQPGHQEALEGIKRVEALLPGDR